jgi:hypothetical protein
MYDPKRNYKTRLGAGKAWITSGLASTAFGPSPHGNWERNDNGNSVAKGPALAQKAENRQPPKSEPKNAADADEKTVLSFLQTYFRTPREDKGGLVLDRKEYEAVNPRANWIDLIEPSVVIQRVSIETGPIKDYLAVRLFGVGLTGRPPTYLRRMGEGFYKLDWAATVGYNPTHLAAFVSSDDQTATLRLTVWLDDHYNYQYASAKATHYSINLLDSFLNPGDGAHGYVPKDSETGKKIYGILEDGRPHQITIALKKTGEMANHLEVTRLFNSSWLK